jgi:hypothetical protein
MKYNALLFLLKCVHIFELLMIVISIQFVYKILYVRNQIIFKIKSLFII